MFGNKAKPTKIYRYGALEPTENLPLVNEQIWRAHRYANDLIAAERDRRQAVDAALTRYVPDLLTVEAEVQRVEAELEELRAAISRQNAKERRRRSTPEQREAIREKKESLATLYARRKELRSWAFGVPESVQEAREALAAYKKRVKRRGKKLQALPEYQDLAKRLAQAEEAWYDIWPLARELAAIDAANHQRRLSLRASCGCYWGTYLTVEDALSDMRQGAPPEFRRWSGEGKVAVQFQGGLSVADAFAGTDTRLQIRLLPMRWQSKQEATKRRAVLRMRVDSTEDGKPIWTEVPILLHRPLPEQATISWVYLMKKNAAYRERWDVCFFLAQEEWEGDPQTAVDGSVGIDVGWWAKPEGIRIAYWVGSDGAEGEWVLPLFHEGEDGNPYDPWAKADSLRSIRDLAFEEARDTLARWMKSQESLPAWLVEAASYLSQWKSPAKLRRLCLTWAESRFDGDEEAFAALDAWSQQECHLRTWEDATRTYAVNWRNEMVRQFVVSLRRRYRTAHIEKGNWKSMMRVRQPEETDEARQARHHYRIGSPATVQKIIAEGFARVVWKDAQYTTLRCSECGRMDSFDKAKERVRTCQHCGGTMDQDERAARNLLGASEVASA